MASPDTTAQPATFGRTALVTGGTSGISLETACRLGETGVALIVVNGRDAGRGERACTALGHRAPSAETIFVQARAERCRSLMPDGLGIFVNSACGDIMPKLFHEIAPDEIEGTIQHWLFSVLHVCRATLPLMGEGSSIISGASDAAKVPIIGETVIGAALSGITMFTRSLAMEAKRRGIRVNAVTPSLVGKTGTFDRSNADPFSAKLFAKGHRDGASRPARCGRRRGGDRLPAEPASVAYHRPAHQRQWRNSGMTGMTKSAQMDFPEAGSLYFEDLHVGQVAERRYGIAEDDSLRKVVGARHADLVLPLGADRHGTAGREMASIWAMGQTLFFRQSVFIGDELVHRTALASVDPEKSRIRLTMQGEALVFVPKRPDGRAT